MFESDDVPDLVPIGTWVVALFAVLLAIGVAGAVSGAWETLLLWVNRVPFSPTGSVTDPVFGKDISFFLFEMPFFRFVQSLASALLLAALAVTGARYLLSTTEGGEVFITRVRVHLAVIAGLYLLTIAFGYQLDKYELVYSQAGVATGVAFADANARFMAYDVLTFLSGIAGALLIAGAFTRWLWPLGLVVGVWFAASILLGRVYPEVIQRFSVDPNTYAQEEQYIANNLAMTQLGFGIADWDSRSYSGTTPLTREAILNEADTFTNARLWDYRPLQTTLDQIQTVRQYYDFYDVDTDRYIIDGNLRQVMLSGRELAIEKNSQATSWVNQRIIYTHGIGLAMVPVNEVTTEGQPTLWIRDLPPVSSQGAPTINAGPDLLRRGGQPLHRDAGAAAGVRLPARLEQRARRRDDLVDRRHRRAAQLDAQPAAVRAPVPRPRPADLGPGDGRQPAAVPPDDERAAAADRAVPRVRQGSLPRHRRSRPPRLRPGRVHDQRPLPARRAGSTRTSWATRPACGDRPSTTSGTA